MPSVLYIADRGMPSFQAAPLSVDVVCAGDSITGWNNFGGVRDWPYRTYPEFLQGLCESLGLRIANGGIAGEVSPNGVGQVRGLPGLVPERPVLRGGVTAPQRPWDVARGRTDQPPDHREPPPDAAGLSGTAEGSRSS